MNFLYHWWLSQACSSSTLVPVLFPMSVFQNKDVKKSSQNHNRKRQPSIRAWPVCEQKINVFKRQGSVCVHVLVLANDPSVHLWERAQKL